MYAAANPQCSLLDLFDEWKNGQTLFLSHLMGGTTPADNQAEYEKESPISKAHLVKTPTLIFHGTNDFLPVAIVQKFYDKINAAGTPTDFYRFINEEHGLLKETSQFAAAQAQLEWFRKYLRPKQE